MSHFDMDAFRRQMDQDFRDVVRRQAAQAADRLRQDLAAGRIWVSGDAGQEEPYRPHRNHGCDPAPTSLFWGDLDLTGHQSWVFIDPGTGIAVAAAPLTDDGAYVITTLPTEGDQPT
ncbi:hypothetical protein [Nocardioides sp. L-11A]|uniref:hypothetical protein n=1 Tax=Nocardioides sp. L-11A TaxID=3043848 RepID=UPI00249A6CE1|nr:hypothetical protein QJ852_09890 [Nocardioides sp. L-11A]